MMRVYYEGAQLSLQPDDRAGVYWITSLRTEVTERNKGYAKKVLRFCKRFADRKQICIKLWASSYWDKPMTNKQLVSFYKKMGFVVTEKRDGVYYLEYTPRRNK